MTKDDKEIVSAIQLALADKVGADRFETWFGAHTRLSLLGDALSIGVPSPFYQDWLRKHFRPQIEAACLEVLGRVVVVTFQVDAGLAPAQTSAMPRPGANGTSPLPPGGNTGRNAPSGAAENGSPGLFARRRFASFDTFILGACNRLAYTAARQVLEQPGCTSPLVLYGPTGVGKTHLLESIWVASRRLGACDAVYLTAEQFATIFIEALNGRGLPSFRRKYRGLDLLIVDDLHFFANKRATQTELLHTIDSLQSAGKQLVFGSDRAPTTLADFQPELVARLQGGVTCGLEPPDYETRLGIVRRMAANLAVVADDEVWQYVAEVMASHARVLLGAVKRLQLASAAAEQPITRALAEEALSEIRKSAMRSVRLADVEQAVCRSFDLDPASLKTQGSSKRLQAARMLAMWLARKHTHSALSEIGKHFGLRSHSTVVSAQKRIDLLLAGQEPVNLGSQRCPMDEAVRRVERLLLVG